MATTRLGVNDKAELRRDFELLFGRCYALMPCPIAGTYLPALYNNLVPEPYKKAAVEMMARGYNCELWFLRTVEFVVPVNNIKMTFCLTIDDVPGGRPPATIFDRLFMQRPRSSKTQPYGDVSTAELELAFGEHGKPLLDWGWQYATLVNECFTAWDTAAEIIEMTSTAGQLRRMVPEMLQYLPDEKRTVLERQVRSSAIPHEWTYYDRRRVRDMLTTMAKCWLMPKHERIHRTITDHAPDTWARIGPPRPS
jgi:hypothetical protein